MKSNQLYLRFCLKPLQLKSHRTVEIATPVMTTDEYLKKYMLISK